MVIDQNHSVLLRGFRCLRGTARPQR